MPTPSSGRISFSDFGREYRGDSRATISMSQLGYGGSLNRQNDCTDQARSDSSVPFSATVIGLPVFSGPGSNLKMSQFYNRSAYAAPPNGTFTVYNRQNKFNFAGLFDGGRNWNPNPNLKNTNPLFMHITNSADVTSDTPIQAAGIVSFQANSVLFFRNFGNLLGDAGDGGNGGGGQGGNLSKGGTGGTGGGGFASFLYTILDNRGVIYGGGGGGGGGGGTHQSYNECWVCGPSNKGAGGGGGGGGQTGQSSSGGAGGTQGPQGGGNGTPGGNGSRTGPGGGGSGGSGGGAGGGGRGGNGGGWGQNGGNGGTSNGGAGGPGGFSYILESGKVINPGSIAGSAGIGAQANSLSASQTFSASYTLQRTQQPYTVRGRNGALITQYRTVCQTCTNPKSSASWFGISPATTAFTGSGLVINVTRISGSSTVTRGNFINSCGTCNYSWYYVASIVSRGRGYISGRSQVSVSLGGDYITFTVF